jgi:hypothetical protein
MNLDEKLLCHAALDASITEVKRLCMDTAGVLKQWESRSLVWDELSMGSTRIQLVLSPEIAQAFRK